MQAMVAISADKVTAPRWKRQTTVISLPSGHIFPLVCSLEEELLSQGRMYSGIVNKTKTWNNTVRLIVS